MHNPGTPPCIRRPQPAEILLHNRVAWLPPADMLCRRQNKAARRAAERAGAAAGDVDEAERLAAEEAEFDRAKVGHTAAVAAVWLPPLAAASLLHTVF